MAKLKLVKRSNDIPPAPPGAPLPPAGEPQSAKSEAEARHHRISVAAYYRAQARGFGPGRDQEDWYAAERDIDRT